MAKRTRPTRQLQPVAQAPAQVARPDLDTEFANRLRDPFEQTYMGVLQTNDPLLLERGNASVEIYRDLKRDGKVFSGLQKRQLALIGKPWQVEPVDKEAPGATKAAETVTKILKGFAFDNLCKELLEALLCGFAPAEIVWTIRDNLVVPARVVKRAQRRFKYLQLDEHKPPALHMLVTGDMLRGIPVPDRKFIVHRVNAEDDNPYGTGLGLQLYWAVFFKRKGIVAWNKLNDRFGSPTPHGEYPRNATPAEKQGMAAALRAMSNDGYLLTPEGMKIKLLESSALGNVTTQQALCEYMDDWIMAVLTGQEPSRSSGGALAAASKEREDVREDLTQADSDLLSETLNTTLLAWICELNGLAPCLVYRQIKQEDDVRNQAETDKVVSEMGFELDEATIRAKYGEGWHKKAPAPPPPSPLQPGNRTDPEDPASAEFAEGGEPLRDALDHLVDAELGEWEPLMEPIRQRLQAVLDAAIANGDTAEQLLARLPQLLDELDTTALNDVLARLGFVARAGAEGGVTND